jgi:E3 ubiquitin-protein ligase SHPRH
VSTPEFKDLPREIDECSTTINGLEVKLARMVVKGRFLQYLGSKEHQTEDDLRDECIICMGSSDDKQAVLLACGHFFCIVSDETSLSLSNSSLSSACGVALLAV